MFKTISSFIDEHEGSLTHLITDESMLPVYRLGDYVGGVPLASECSANALNKVCIVETAQGDVLIREVTQGSTPDLYSLKPLNPRSTLNIQVLHDQSLAKMAPVLMHIKNSCLSEITLEPQ